MEELEGITAIVLAGGKSSRMGQDKGLMLFNEQPMVEHVLQTVKELTDNVMIIANQKGYEKFGYPVYEDLIKDKGPLAGIYTGLSYSKTEMNLIVSCDAPLVSKELIKYLLRASKGYDVTIPKKDGKTHQLIGLFNKNCIERFEEALKKDELKAIKVFETLNLNIVDANQFDAENFKNINYKSDITS